MKETFSQLGEDSVVDHYLAEKEKGYYVDIGAFDPISLSNTYLFYKRGWRGVCVEPNALLAGHYRDIRPDDRFFTEACGLGELKFRLSDEHPALSSCGTEGVPVKARTLSEYLEMLPNIDLLSVDAEGMELDILKTNDWNKNRPTCIVVEILDYVKKTKHQEVIDYLTLQGYRLVCDNSINAILLEKELYNKLFLINA